MKRSFFRDERPSAAEMATSEDVDGEKLFFAKELQQFEEAIEADKDLETFSYNMISSMDTVIRSTQLLELERETLVDNYRQRAQALLDKAEELQALDYVLESYHSDVSNMKRKVEDYLTRAAELAEADTEELDKEAFGHLKYAYGILEQAEHMYRKAKTILHKTKEIT